VKPEPTHSRCHGKGILNPGRENHEKLKNHQNDILDQTISTFIISLRALTGQETEAAGKSLQSKQPPAKPVAFEIWPLKEAIILFLGFLSRRHANKTLSADEPKWLHSLTVQA
jgi:hypothetical protein